jgi:hypothetical protein
MGYKSVEEKLDDIRHVHMDLTEDVDDPRDGSGCRPRITLWAEIGDKDPAHVVLMLDTLWGYQRRHVDLYPLEARELAKKLIAMADKIDEIIDNHEPPDPPGFEGGFAANH